MASGLKISIKWKLFAVVAVLITVAIFVIVSRTSSIFRQDKEAFVKELSAKLASSTAKNFLTRITTLQDKLVIFISSRESLAHTGARSDEQLQVLFSRYQEFAAVAFLTPEDGGRLKVSWVVRNPQGEGAKWPADYEKSFLTTLNIKSAAGNGRGFWRAQTPDGDWLSVLGFGVQVLDVSRSKSSRGIPTTTGNSKLAWVVGILPANAFDDLLTDFSTGLTTGFVVDDQGIAVAHSDPVSRWKNLKTLSIVSSLMKGDRPAETGDFIDSNGRATIGSFEFIPKINLAAVVTTPRDKAFEAADVLSRDIFFIGALILLISLAVAVLLSNYLTGPLQRLALIAAQIGGGDFKVPIDVESNDEIGDLAGSFKKMEQGLIERDEKLNSTQMALVQSEKMSAFGQLSAGIAHEVKNPLAGILGHAQLAMGKVKSDDVKKHLEVIEKETRRCKTIVENLMKFARAEKAELQPTNLAQVVQDTINLVDHQLTLSGCKIFKDFRPCPLVEANGNMLQQVLLNLMVNSSHAMETCPVKNVTVRVLQVANKAQIQVEDTGMGIPPEIQKKIFEPFFTTKPAGKGTGLGLSVSIGIVKDHKGEIYIKSEAGKGTTFFIDIPLKENAAMPSKPLENTHGGQMSPSAPDPATLTAKAPTPAPAASSTPPPTPATPAVVKISPTPPALKFTVAPTEVKKIPAPLQTKPTEKVALKVETKNPPPLKEAVKEVPKPAEPTTGNIPKGVPKLKSTKVATAVTAVKTPVTTVQTEEEFIFSERINANPSLGGKDPLDEKTVNLPAPPPPDEMEPAVQTSMTGTDNKMPPPQQSPSSGKASEITEFKVKIKRPKLKV